MRITLRTPPPERPGSAVSALTADSSPHPPQVLRQHGRVHPSALPSVRPGSTGDDLLLDVRERDEWDEVRAPGAVHVPLHELPGRLDDVRALVGEGRVSVVCHLGGRSAQATAFLLAQGVPARNVEGGMNAWEAAGLPVERGPAAPTT